MSLTTDSIFIQALSWSPDGQDSVLKAVNGRVYGTAIPLPDEDLDNEPVPYVIVGFQGMTNQGVTKDNPFEGDSDDVQITVTATATTLDGLHALMVMVRQRVLDFFCTNYEEPDIPSSYQLTAGPIAYDSQKPCYWQTLTYNCSTVTD